MEVKVFLNLRLYLHISIFLYLIAYVCEESIAFSLPMSYCTQDLAFRSDCTLAYPVLGG